MSGHSRLAPSSAKTWTVCTAQIPFLLANASRLGDGGSSYADEGTEAHRLAELVLTGQMTEAEVPPEFAPVLEYTGICKTLRNRWQGEVFVEAKVPLFYLPAESGTVDYAIIAPDRIIIRDLKYGAGQFVEVTENKQLAIYAFSFVEEMDVLYGFSDDMVVDIGISQPRYAGEETHRVWLTTVGELRQFCAPIQEAANAILAGLDDPAYASKYLVFRPSYDVCFWCKAGRASLCKAKAEAINAVRPDLLAEFDDLEDGEQVHFEILQNESDENGIERAVRVTDQQVLQIIRHKRQIVSIIEAAEETANRRALEGKPIPGTKLVQGRLGNRSWTDEEAASKLLHHSAQFFTAKLKSPTQVTALLKGDEHKDKLAEVEKLIHRAPGKPVAALEDDPRPGIADTLAAFDDHE